MNRGNQRSKVNTNFIYIISLIGGGIIKIKSEKYYPIPWFEDYMLSINGRIILKNNPDIIIKRIVSKGCDKVILRNNNVVMVIPLDRLMMNIFVGKLNYKIIHSDGDKDNCNIKNLKYEIIYDDIIQKCFCGVVFKQIPDFSRYYISENGIIFNMRMQNFMRIGYDHQGYQNLHMTNNNGEDIHVKVHSLMMATYIGKRPEKMVCHHKDSIEYHNELYNLEYVYQYDNIYESFLCNDQKMKLQRTKKDVHNICQLIVNGKSNSDIIEIFEIGKSKYHNYYVGIQDIRTKRTWTHISDKYF